MDLSYFLILIVLAVIIDVYVHYWIAARQVKQLRAESVRFEAEWQKFLVEIQTAVNQR